VETQVERETFPFLEAKAALGTIARNFELELDP
jgi:hypothetical protein